MKHILSSGLVAAGVLALIPQAHAQSRSQLEAMAARHAAANGVPLSLVHRVIMRESRYNPRAVGRGGAMGLMQIKHATARGVGYGGSASGLLDAETNMTYAVRYLAGAYRVARGNHDLAVRYYASGYYYAAKRQGLAGPRSSARAEARASRRAARAQQREQRPQYWVQIRQRLSGPAPSARDEARAARAAERAARRTARAQRRAERARYWEERRAQRYASTQRRYSYTTRREYRRGDWRRARASVPASRMEAPH